MAGVKLNLDSAIELRRAMEFLQLDMTALHKDVGEYLLNTTRDRFKTETGPEGQRWHELADSTKARKRKKGRSPKILTEEHRLRDQLQYHATKDSLELGSALPYARIQQLGGRAGRGGKVTLIARPYLGLSPADSTELQAKVAEHIERALAERL